MKVFFNGFKFQLTKLTHILLKVEANLKKEITINFTAFLIRKKRDYGIIARFFFGYGLKIKILI